LSTHCRVFLSACASMLCALSFTLPALAANPDLIVYGDYVVTMDPNQPVILNLTVENNVPSMLRSLQATRSIQEIFEKRVNKE
jgi:hypothetical protein